MLAVGLDFAEELVFLLYARGEIRRAELHARAADPGLGLELEALPVQVVPVRDVELHLDGAVVDGAGGHAKGFLGFEQVGFIDSGVGKAGAQRYEEGQQADEDHGRVSCATQPRYSGRPRSTGTAMISGSS